MLNKESTNVGEVFNVIEKVEEHVLKSDSVSEIPEEEIDMCIRIIVVDAFVRCKIFKNPRGYIMLLLNDIKPEMSIYYCASLLIKEIGNQEGQDIVTLYKTVKEKISNVIKDICLLSRLALLSRSSQS